MWSENEEEEASLEGTGCMCTRLCGHVCAHTSDAFMSCRGVLSSGTLSMGAGAQCVCVSTKCILSSGGYYGLCLCRCGSVHMDVGAMPC